MPVQSGLPPPQRPFAPGLRHFAGGGLAPGTLCGWVRNIGRGGQTHRILTLAQLQEEPVDMFTTVFIGNSTTRLAGDRLVTPRGYQA